ncbi:AraC family transcriptional regulator [Nocardia abscessus]|uniref:helix-turn-helix transcriptional regulator n=1 Tax=Nocardia TaxID=1817 RepID=UPI001892ECC7|nr:MULTISPECIES: helix-turn-helix transcriptional regulator [Nocardia]MBF6218402.1 AraC family transcriptional regulator [Nocardia abscessus]MDE1669947.1 helix-turn-helix transcriptional regulator [Nocardia gipuzkoensis]
MNEVAAYRERPSRVKGAVLWTKTVDGRGPALPVLPDGCMDLIWMAGRLIVAGPDTRAHHPGVSPGGRYVGVRFFPGTAPALLGVSARELRDQRVDLTQVWPSATVRSLVGRLADADDPAAALEGIVLRRAADAEPADPLLRRVVGALEAGRPVAAVAEAAGLGERTLHRRCVDAFGYGPKTLARVLRMQRALATARSGVPLADTATLAGFADQAHLSREVRALAGTSMGDLLARSERDLAGYSAPVGSAAYRSTPLPSGSSTTA